MKGLYALFCLFSQCESQDLAKFKSQIQAAIVKVDEITNKIEDRWQINDFPNFLKSVAMSSIGWEILKDKFQSKIIGVVRGKKEQFVVSFMGSSVTAGHDTAFNITFPSLVGNIMSPAFDLLGVEFESRNSAMGNNPCLPYDACVHAFAGKDADIVHWEQSFNCFFSDNNHRLPAEQFIRQSLSLPHQPIVIFSTSETPNWGKEACDKIPPLPTPSDDDKRLVQLIKQDPIKVVTELNKKLGEHNGPWGAIQDLISHYKSAGIQTWEHKSYEGYKCYGPYIPDWGCCSASWHPSILGHELRAAHYSYFWLLILKDALQALSKMENIDDYAEKLHKHIQHEHSYHSKKAIVPSDYSDTLTCYTTYEPLNDLQLNLNNLFLPPKPVEGKLPFQLDIMENSMDKNIIINARKAGYKDYKYVFQGNKNNIPLSFMLHIEHEGKIILCEPPGTWGKLPDHYDHFYTDGMSQIYITSVTDFHTFEFDINNAKKVKFSEGMCSVIDEYLKRGRYVLTIVPLSEKGIMISYLILP